MLFSVYIWMAVNEMTHSILDESDFSKTKHRINITLYVMQHNRFACWSVLKLGSKFASQACWRCSSTGFATKKKEKKLERLGTPICRVEIECVGKHIYDKKNIYVQWVNSRSKQTKVVAYEPAQLVEPLYSEKFLSANSSSMHFETLFSSVNWQKK